MFQIPGYEELELIYESKRTTVYKSIRISDKLPVILKILNSEYPNLEELSSFKKEFEITKSLEFEGVVKVLNLEKFNNNLILVFEDFKGESFSKVLSTKKLDLNEFLDLSKKILNILSKIHDKNIIHKDLTPSNILWNKNTNEVQIIDFGISTNLTTEQNKNSRIDILEGTLFYISPEQTGRMNRSIDYRSDYYSLGIMFYEMLIGKVPFENQDPIQLVYSHIAILPKKLNLINLEIPETLSDLVSKLISKNSEDRYQSIAGIIHDLEMIQDGNISYNEVFLKLGMYDISGKLLVPQKLYGREKEIELLLKAFERSIQIQSELLLIKGYSGIGKSSIVAEIYKPITAKNGYFLTGKFDQFNREIPYKAFVDLFRELVKQLLSEPEKELQKIREKLSLALGENGQLIIDIIPEIELIIGKQNPMIELPMFEARNRFKILFQKFINVFINRERPIVIFLDDLQWADNASLNLIQLLLTTSSQGMLFISAYRDNEITLIHPLNNLFDELEKLNIAKNTILLEPLKLNHIINILSETLSLNDISTEVLAELVLSKTEGNPFFINEFLKSLYSEKLLIYSNQTKKWVWDFQKILNRSFTENVIELMANKIRQFPSVSQELLMFAASIGNQFDLLTISALMNKNISEIEEIIFPAIRDSYLLYLGEEILFNTKELKSKKFKFNHDRIQQSAYLLIPENERNKIHFEIGKVLLKIIPQDKIDENIFIITNQLNLGKMYLTSSDEIKNLALFNLKASRKAKISSAYQASLSYAKESIKLFGENNWNEYYNEFLELHELIIELSSLLGDFTEMNEYISKIDSEKIPILDLVNINFTKIQALASQNKLSEAIEFGKKFLIKLGVIFPEQPKLEDFLLEINHINFLLKDKNIQDLFYLKKMNDKEKLAVMKIAACLIPACFNAGSPLFVLLNILQVSYSIQFGNCSISCFAYVNYSIVINNITKEINTSEEFRKVAFKLALEPDSALMKAGTYIGIGIFLHHRKYHLKESIEILKLGLKTAYETGALEFVGYSSYAICMVSFWIGNNILELQSVILKYRKNLIEQKLITTANYCTIFLDATITLNGTSNLSIEIFNNESLVIKESLNSGDKVRLFFFYLYRMTSNYYLNKIQDAIEDSKKARIYLNAGSGTISEAGFYFFDSLILIRKFEQYNYEELNSLEEKSVWILLQSNLENLKLWTKFAPMNHEHKLILIEAEFFRIKGNIIQAIEMYDKSIQLANKFGYIQDEALANELFAKFWLIQKKTDYAKLHFEKSIYLYNTWGAELIVKRIEKEYLFLNTKRESLNQKFSGTVSLSVTASTTSSKSKSTSSLLDIFSLIKSSQTISEEIQLESLLEKVIWIILENAGAEKGVLILKEEEWKIQVIANISNAEIQILKSITLNNASEIIPKSIVQYSIRTGEMLVINDATNDKRYATDPYLNNNNVKSVLCEPIHRQGELVALLYLENNLSTNTFTEDRLEILKMLSSQAIISIENAKLYKNLEDKVKERTAELNNTLNIIKKDLTLAKKIQQNTLKVDTSKIESLNIVTIYQPMAEVGGDYYSITKLNDTVYRIFLADATGHGVQAAMMTMAIKGIYDNLKNFEMDTSNLMDIFNNEYMQKYNSLNSFLTCVIIDIDFMQKKIKYTSAGHPASVLLKSEQIHFLEKTGKMIGIKKNTEYTFIEYSFDHGDKLFLFTDGIFEEFNIDNVEFGEENFYSILKTNQSLSLNEIIDISLAELNKFMNGSAIQDDITLIGVELK